MTSPGNGQGSPDVVVIGHTDRVGSLQFNDRLSLQRAERELPGDIVDKVEDIASAFIARAHGWAIDRIDDVTKDLGAAGRRARQDDGACDPVTAINDAEPLSPRIARIRPLPRVKLTSSTARR